MDINEQKKFIFVKDYKCPMGTIKENTVFTITRGTLYMNGGMLTPAFQKIFMKLFSNKKFREEYLKEEEMIHNKI